MPVAVCRDRAAAGRLLFARHPECDVLVADDGLQHYGLARDVELVVFDARGVGNGHLPCPRGRCASHWRALLQSTRWCQRGCPATRLPPGVPAFQMRLAGATFVSFSDPALRCAPGDLAGKSLHAFAGIGDPARFFGHLEALGLRCIPTLSGSSSFRRSGFRGGGGSVVLLTEKDAVKCAGLITGEAWVLPVGAELSPGLIERILEKIDGRKAA